MAWGDLPKVKKRRWTPLAKSYRDSIKARRMAKWLRSRPDVGDARVRKETRWVVSWRPKEAK